MAESTEILAAIKALQAQLEGQIQATNLTFKKLASSVDARFAALRNEGGSTGNPFDRGPPRITQTEISPVLRSMKMDVPKFDGTDPQGWIFRVEEFFDFHCTPEHMRLRIASFHMEGKAAAWFQWMKANNLLTTWSEFLNSLKSRFGATPYNDPQGLLSKLTQTTTVADFQSSFEDLMNQVTGIPESLLISFFIAGLRSDIRRELSISRPPTLMDTFALARAFEARLDEARADMKLGPWWNTRGSSPPSPASSYGSNPITHSPSGPRSQPNLAVQIPQSTTTTTTPSLPIKRLTQAEIREKRERGLCYNCDEKWSNNHRCKVKFLLLIGDNDGENSPTLETKNEENFEEEAVGDISSLNSLTSGGRPRSLKLTGKVGRSRFQVLIDSGSTHNFMRPDLVEALHLSPKAISPFRVFVGNGDYLTCRLICPQVPIDLQGNLFTVDMHVLPIEGPGAVLGVQWLQTLGKVVNDYSSLQMEFIWEGKKILLAGEGHPNPEPNNTSADVLSRIFQEPTIGDRSSHQMQSLTAASIPVPEFLEILRQENITFSDMIELRCRWEKGELGPAYEVRNGLLLFNQRYFLSPCSSLISGLLREAHSSTIAGHHGVKRTLIRLAATYFWPKMKLSVENFVASCITCQHITQPLAGLLQPLPIPKQALFGRLSPKIPTYTSGSTKIQASEELLMERDDLRRNLKNNLGQAQHWTRQVANGKRRKFEFRPGDLVLVKHQPHRPTSFAGRRFFYGPFYVKERIGHVAYRLELPEGSRIHPVFHISVLKPFHAIEEAWQPNSAKLSENVHQSQLYTKPIAMCAERNILRCGSPCKQVLIQWEGESLENSTWEDLDEIMRQFPLVHLEDKVALLGGRDDKPINISGPTQAQTRTGPKGKEVVVTVQEQPKKAECMVDFKGTKG